MTDGPAHLPFDALNAALKAAGEATRLRVLALVAEAELTVSDLTDILRQSQPRISRHLKLLAEAGVVDKHREGTWAFFDLAGEGPIAELVADLLDRIADHDPVTAIDLDRLEVVRGRRAAAAQEYFAGVADHWDEERSLHAADEIVEAAILDVANERPYRSVLDLGTGTGRMLHLLVNDGVAYGEEISEKRYCPEDGKPNLRVEPWQGFQTRSGRSWKSSEEQSGKAGEKPPSKDGDVSA